MHIVRLTRNSAHSDMEIPILWILVALYSLVRQLFPKQYRQRLWKCICSLLVPLSWAKRTETTPFFDVLPTASKLTCAAPLAQRRCINNISPKGRNKANSIRRGLSICPPSHPAFASLLSEYARVCLCGQVHAKKDAILHATIEKWTQDLNLAFNAVSLGFGSISICVPGSFEPCSSSTLQQSATASSEHVNSMHTDAVTLLNYKALFSLSAEQVDPYQEPPESIPVRSRSGSWSFLPFVRGLEKTLGDAIWAPLTKEDRKAGSVYAFTREGDETYVKIGYTSDSVANRQTSWERQCGYKPVEVWKSEATVPNARRVEALVHTDLELRSFRRIEKWCRTNPECSKSHIEWFEVAQAHARSCIEYWVNWMTVHEPYDGNGQLKEQWVVAIHLPQADLEADPDAGPFAMDSTGNFWITNVTRDETEQQSSEPTVAVQGSTADLDTTAAPQATQDRTPEASDSPGHRSRAPPTPRRSPKANTQSRRGLKGSASEPTLPSTAMVGVDPESDVTTTPASPAVHSRTRTSSSNSTPSTRVSKSPNTTNRRRGQSTPSKLIRQVTAESTPADRVQVDEPERGSSLNCPIIIESDSDVPTVLPQNLPRSSGKRRSHEAVRVKKEVLDSLPVPSLKPRRRSSPIATSSREPTSGCIPTGLPERVTKIDITKRFSWRCPQCLSLNSAFTSMCKTCRYCAPGFEFMEEVDLPTVPRQSNDRPLRPTFLDQVPASDPVVPLARDEFGTDEHPKPRLIVKAKSTRKSEKVLKTRQNRDDSEP